MAGPIRIAVLANASQAVGEFGKVESKAKGMGKVLGSAGAVFKGVLGANLVGAGVGAAAAGISKLTGVLSESVSEARESQKVGATTAQIIKATGGAARVSADDVGALATALSNKTGVDDEAIQSGANLLLTFKNVKNEGAGTAAIFDRATAAATDLSAAGFGSIEGSSKMLGKALNDPIKGISALGRAGVTFTDQQKDQIKTLVQSGDVLGAQKIILGEVESQVGGVAAANATAGEKALTLANNLKEQFGTALLPALDGVLGFFVDTLGPAISKGLDAITPALKTVGENVQPVLEGIFGLLSGKGAPAGTPPWLTTLVDAARSLAPVFSQVAAAVKPVLDQLGPVLGQAFEALSPIIGQLASAFAEVAPNLSPLGLVLQALAPVMPVVAGAFVQLATAVGGTLGTVLATVVPLLVQLGGVVATTLVPVLSQLVTTLLPPLIGIVTAVLGIVAQLVPVLAPIVAQLVGQLLPVVAQLVTALLPVLGAVLGAVGQVLQALAPVLVQVGGLLGEVFAQAVPVVVMAVGIVVKVVTALMPVIRVVLNTIVGVVKGALKIIQGVIQVVMGVISGNWRQVWQGLGSIVSGIWGVIKSVVGGAIKSVQAIIGGTLQAISDKARSIWSAIGQAFSKGVSAAVGFVKSLPGKAKTALGNVGTALLSAGRNLIQGFINGISGAIGAVVSKAREVASAAVNAAKNALGIASPSKVFKEIGAFVGKGLAIGLKGSEKDVRSASQKLSDLLVKEYRAQDKIEAAAKARAKKTSGKKRREAQAQQRAADVAGNRAKRAVVTLRRLDDKSIVVAKQREALAVKLADAQDRLNDLTKQYADYQDSATSAARSFASITSLTVTDSPQTAASIQAGLASRLEAVRTFRDKLQALVARGLNKSTYDQLIRAGVEQGTDYVNALFAGTEADLRGVNQLQENIDQVTAGLGVDAARTMYGAGVQAQQGLVDGLLADSKRLEDAATTLAQAMVKAMKDALKIKSPSRTFREIGAMTVAGLTIGLDESPAKRAGVTLADALRSGFGQPSLSVAGSAARGGGGNTYHVDVTVPLGATRAEVGREVVEAIREFDRTQGRR